MKPRWYSSNPCEQVVAQQFESAGWRVYRSGWPDFLMEKNGELRFVEVKTAFEFIGRDGKLKKSRKSKLTTEQRRVRRLLRLKDIEVETILVDRDKLSPLEQDRLPSRADVLTWKHFTG